MQNPPLPIICHEKFNNYKSVHVIFYTQNESGIFNFLVIKESSCTHYHELKDEITELDSTPIFTASRLMIERLRGCLSNSNIQKIIESKVITIEDLLPSNMEFYEVFEHSVFFEGVRRILNSPCVIDTVEGKLVILLGIPYISLHSINKLLNKGSNEIHLKWITYQTLKNNEEIDPWLQCLANYKDLPSHIESSLAWEQEDNEQADTYVVLSCKPVNQQNIVDPLYLHFPALFQGFFRRSRERWLHFNAAQGEFPSEQQMKTVKAVIIPGSSISAYDRHHGIKNLKKWIRDFDQKYPDIRMLGICFGAQIISEALGGKVKQMPQRADDPSFYYLGTEKLKVDEEFFSLPFTKSSNMDKEHSLCIVEAHGDEIIKLPDGFKNFGSSKLCKNELIVSEDLRYLAFQGHPEYDAEYIAARCAVTSANNNAEQVSLDSILRIKSKMLDLSFRNQATNENLRTICYSFLKKTT